MSVAGAAENQSSQVTAGTYRGVVPIAKFDSSPPLREMKPLAVPSGGPLLIGRAMVDPPSGLEWLYSPGPQTPDLVVQSRVGLGSAIQPPLQSFNAQSNISGVNPPDPAGDVGPNHYVAMSNLSLQIFNKTGTSVFGPVFTNTLWTGFGGACETQNSGDPIVLHDQFADRWLITQFTATAVGGQFFNCVAISQTPDPTGAYFRYAFTTGPNFPDYPKYGVWTDAYVISTREFAGSGGPFAGVGAYAVSRSQMIAGNPTPTMISLLVAPGAAAFNTGDGLLPADIDGPTLPPAGSPNYFMGSMDAGGPYSAPQDALTLWKFVINFVTPASSTFTLTNTIPIAAYDTIFPCTGRACIPQPGTTVRVDILSYRQRPLNRLAYRNFGTHESLVTNQSVEAAADIAGIRWWEIRNPNGSPIVYQEGTYAPGVADGTHRWMGSIAMDSAGNMGLGYSASNATTVFPSVWYTGRLASDPLGTMDQGEAQIHNGTGSNTGGGNRWGDYTSMNLDPVDDCTFWYVNQHTPTTSASGWQLRVGSFRFQACGTPSFTMSLPVASRTVCAGPPTSFTVNVGAISGYNSPVTLSTTGQPPLSIATFTPNPVTPLPGTSSFSLTTLGVAPATYPITVNGLATGPITKTANLSLTVQTGTPSQASPTTPANSAGGVVPSVAFNWVAASNVNDYLVQVATDSAFTNIVRTTTTSATSWTPSPALGTSTQYFCRVFARNACSAPELFAGGFEDTAAGSGTVSATSSFTTAVAPGECPVGPAPTLVMTEDFEGAATGWVQEAGGTGTNSWAITSLFPFAGTKALQGLTPAIPSDQRFISPVITLPSAGNGLSLSFQSRQQMESRTAGGCWDGGFIEVSVNGGAYTAITTGLLTDPYNGPLTAPNPAAPAQAWCGDPQAYLKSVIDLAPFAGMSVRFRFRVTSDNSVSRAEGWNIDNVEVKRCN